MKILVLVLLGAMVLPSYGAIYSAVNDFNNTGGSQVAGSTWTYGNAPTLGGPLTLFPTYMTGSCGAGGHPQNICLPVGATVEEWNIGNGGVLLGSAVRRNISGGDITFTGIPGVALPADYLSISPGGANAGTSQFVLVRFTNPTADTYNITGDWRQNDPMSTVDLYIFINGAQQAQSFGSFAFSNVVLAAGAQVDFLVDSRGNQNNDSTGLRATISSVSSPVPEPSTVILSGAGLIAIGYWRRRRTR
jgi:hypothetical protein